uniref:Glabrous enhancer-binding protein-like DBD domain-containing protein n=1 Tax=Oryza brachyantha TaxID=4533 RepID=J3LQJ7_ORYBR
MVSTRRRTAHPGPSDKLRGAQANGSGTGVTLRPSVPGDAAGEAQTNEPRRFVRAWSEPDDLRILECLAAHVKKHRAPPARCQLLGLFAGRGLDKEEFTVTEIYEKVRRLRNQYEKMLSPAARAKATGGSSSPRPYGARASRRRRRRRRAPTRCAVSTPTSSTRWSGSAQESAKAGLAMLSRGD